MLLAHLGTVGEFVQKPDEASLGLVQARVIVTCPEHCIYHYPRVSVERRGEKILFWDMYKQFQIPHPMDRDG